MVFLFISRNDMLIITLDKPPGNLLLSISGSFIKGYG